MADPVKVADLVVKRAEEGLRSLDAFVSGWNAEFQVIMWQAVADLAAQRRDDAEARKS